MWFFVETVRLIEDMFPAAGALSTNNNDLCFMVVPLQETIGRLYGSLTLIDREEKVLVLHQNSLSVDQVITDNLSKLL